MTTSAPVGDRFAGSRLQRLSGESAEPPTPPRRHWCPDSDRPDHLWWGYHCRLDKTLQTKYGFTCDGYHRLLHEEQGGRCALCGGRPRRWRLVPHHDHQTGEVLAVLHFTCNRLVDPLLWLLPRLVALMVDPPGRRLGLVIPPAKLRRLEARDAAKQKRRRDQRPTPVPDRTTSDFHERTRAALEVTKQGGR